VWRKSAFEGRTLLKLWERLVADAVNNQENGLRHGSETPQFYGAAGFKRTTNQVTYPTVFLLGVTPVPL
jgi:hypothetical protein